MKTIATKSRLAITLLCIGAVFSILIGVAIGVNKPDGWQVCIVVSVIFFGATIFGIIYELLQPQVLIKADDKNFYVYHKRRWKTIPFTDVISVDFHNAKSRQIVLNFGYLKIFTACETIRIEIVKNVKRVALSITSIIREGDRESRQ